MVNNQQRSTIHNGYTFSNAIVDWDLGNCENILLKMLTLQNKEKPRLKHLVFGFQTLELPTISEGDSRYNTLAYLYFMTRYLNKKIDLIESTFKQGKNLQNEMHPSELFNPITTTLYDIQYYSIELLTFLRIYLDTLVLFVSDCEFESITDSKFYTEYKINKTPHIKAFLKIIGSGSNNLKHLARNRNFNHASFDSLTNPTVLLELSTKYKPNSVITAQPIYDLIDSTDMFVLRLVEALNDQFS